MVQLISCSGMLLAVSIFYLDLVRLHSKIIIHFWCHEKCIFFDQIFVLQEFQHIDVNLVSVVIAFAIGMINALVYCYFGEMAIGSHEKMHDSVFDLKWYQLPIAIQKYLILMAGNMQRPLHYHGFGILDLNLKTFNQVRANSRKESYSSKLLWIGGNWIVITFKSYFFTANEISVFVLHDD